MMPTFYVATLFAIANRDATGPTSVEDLIEAGIIIGKFAVEIRDSVLLISQYGKESVLNTDAPFSPRRIARMQSAWNYLL